MATISHARQFIKADLYRWGRNTLVFAGPALLVLLASIADVIPSDASWGVLALYALNLLVDAFRKWLTVNRYQ